MNVTSFRRGLAVLTALALLAQGFIPLAAASKRAVVVSSGAIRPLPAGDTVLTNAATTANASINMPHGTAPTSPVNGDCWTTTAGLYCRINGVTKGPFSDSAASGTVTSVAVSGGATGLSTSGGPVIASGTITLTGTLDLDNGGTGATTAGAARTALGVAIGSNVQAYDADLTTFAGITPSANVQTLLGAADYAGFRNSLGLGTIAPQAASAIAVTGGTMAGVTITGGTLDTGGGTISSSGGSASFGSIFGSYVVATDSYLDTMGAGLHLRNPAAGYADQLKISAASNEAHYDAATHKFRDAAGTTTFATIDSSGITATLVGNAATATKLATARTLAVTGDLAWTSPSFDGSGNVTAAGTLATVNANVGSFGSATQSLSLTVNGKGLVTAAAAQTVTPALGSITGLGTGVATALALNVGSAGASVTFNGALGTPSSGTLTNATGLPVAGITASTATALGVGSLELGHASDTTIARVSAGVISVEGTNVLLNGGALGTPSSGTLTNATGLPIAGLTASTATALGLGSVELGHASDTSITRVSAGVVAVEGVNVLLSGGALGTPSSGTLTNATGLPVAGITASTATALGVGSLELGHASDTTITRVSAGVVAVEGTNVLLNGGALGTPSSGTLTNATGLPVAGITSSTSTALGVGSLELGAASDTTIARVSAGVISVEGVTQAPLASPVFTGVMYWQQGAPTAVNSTGTLTIANLLTGIITTTSATAVALTLPTGTLTDAGILSGALANDRAFDWYLINLGSSSGAMTLTAGAAHTIVGNAVCAIATTCHWLTRKTATNTFVTYRAG